MTTVRVHGSGWALPYEIQKDNFEFVRRKSVTVPFRPPQQRARTSQSCLRARVLPWLPLHLPRARQTGEGMRSAAGAKIHATLRAFWTDLRNADRSALT